MKKILYWFRQDLRLSDNPALYEAAKSGQLLLIFILDDVNAGQFALGGASKWWLHHSLTSLNKSLDGSLHFYKGNPADIISKLVKEHSINEVYWNRCYEPWQTERDTAIKQLLKDKGIQVNSYNGSLLWEPWDITKDDNTTYRVFTPYYKKCYTDGPRPRVPLSSPDNISFLSADNNSSVNDLELIVGAKWADKFTSVWDIGEQAALDKFNEFRANGISDYKQGRNFPAKLNVSRLSPYLRFGEISPNYVWYNIQDNADSIADPNIDHFRSELGWREFSYYLLFHNPQMPKQNLKPSFDKFAWEKNLDNLEKWQQGMTGIPIVDAGMRELWQTGYMHNRVRMIVASFLIKNLLIDWKHGERWFWDCLVDADLANNSASWQWVAGSGCDAAPFFRIFNPVTQGQKFDPDGEYTKRFVPELKKLDPKYLFNPWEASSAELYLADIKLGTTYPKPIIDLKDSRARALEIYNSIK